MSHFPRFKCPLFLIEKYCTYLVTVLKIMICSNKQENNENKEHVGFQFIYLFIYYSMKHEKYK